MLTAEEKAKDDLANLGKIRERSEAAENILKEVWSLALKMDANGDYIRGLTHAAEDLVRNIKLRADAESETTARRVARSEVP